MRLKVTQDKKNLYVLPAISIILGIFVCIFKGETIRWGAFAVGAVIFVLALIGLIADVKRNSPQQNITIDGIMIGVSLALMLFAGFVGFIIRVLFGIIFILYGLVKILTIFDDLKPGEAFLVAIEAVVLIVIGVLLFMDKPMFYYVVGGLLILDGILEIIYDVVRVRAIHQLLNEKHWPGNTLDAEVENVKDVE